MNNKIEITEISAAPTQTFKYFTNGCKNRKYHVSTF